MRKRLARTPVRHARAAAVMIAVCCSNARADTTITVTSGGDPDPTRTDTCSLRQALAMADATPPSGPFLGGNCVVAGTGGIPVIEIAPALARSVITLEHGQIEVDSSAHVFAHGVVVDANQASRVLEVHGDGFSNITSVTLEDITLTGGASNDGAGAYVHALGALRLIRSTVTGNVAASNGGGVFGSGSASVDGAWPALFLYDTSVERNTAIRGGGVWTMNMRFAAIRSTLSGNTAVYGAGGYMQESGNPAAPYAKLYRSTVSGNQIPPCETYASNSAGLLILGTPLELHGTTISGNAGGCVAAGISLYGNVTFAAFNSIVAGNIAPAEFGHPDIWTDRNVVPGSADHCVLGSALLVSFPGHGNVFTDAPSLAALADNGGFTPSMRPLPGSAAIDIADNAQCASRPPWEGPPDDQRGVAQPQGVHCDAGAVEVRQGSVTIAASVTGAGHLDALPVPSGAGSSAGIVDCTSSGGNSCSATYVGENDASTAVFSATPQAGWHFAAWSGDCTASTSDATARMTLDADRSCAATFAIDQHTIGGIVQDLAGSGLVLRLNGANDLPIVADGHYTFATSLDHGTPYTVSIATQPSDPAQTCFIPYGSGVANDDVDDIAVICSTGPITVDLSVAIDDGRALAVPGDAPTYTITVRNDSDSVAYGVALSSTVSPTGALGAIAWACDGACIPAAGTGDVALTLDLPARSRTTVTLDGIVGVFDSASLDVGAHLVLRSFYADTSGTHDATDSDTNPIIFRDGFDGIDSAH